jgi:uncharacterized membrane protein
MIYTCPMHPEVKQDKPGRCPKCGMELVPQNEATTSMEKPEKDSYAPLFTIIGLIILVSATVTLKDIQGGPFVLQRFISYFMIGFFLVFGAFKLIDLKGFAQGYSTYDLLAKRIFIYGYIYPFIELAFGLGMILYPQSELILLLELLVMSFSGLGVAIKIAKKEKFRCVCLGTFLKVPLTKVTLIEDFGMAFLALLLLILK